MRTFVAVEITDTLKKALIQVQDRLRPTAQGVKWVAPEAMHLTLKFLGDIRDTDLPRACELIGQCAARAAKTKIRFSGAGAFPGADRPAVLWVGAQEEPPVLEDLHKGLDAVLVDIGVPRETRGFNLHLTLGRVRTPAHQPDLARSLAQEAGRDYGELEAARIVFMQSDLKPQGPVYTPLSHFALGTV